MRFGHKRSWIYAAIALAMGTPMGIWLSSNIFEPLATEYNITAVITTSSVSLVIGTLFASLGGALEGARMRGGKYERNLSSRSHWRVLVDSLGPTYIAVLLIHILAFLYWLPHAHGYFGAFPLLLPLTSFLVISTHLLLGFNLGLRMPSMVSIPLAMILPFLWISFAFSSEFFPLRYMTGEELGGSCCRIYQQPMNSAVILGFGFNLVISVFLYFWADIRAVTRTQIKTVFKTVVAAGTVAGVLALCSVSTPSVAIEDRSYRDMLCEGTSPVVCLFPKQDPTGESTKTIRRTWGALHTFVPDLAPRVIGANVPSTPHYLGVVVTPSSGQNEMAFSLVSDYVGGQAICNDSEAASSARDDAYSQVLNFTLGQVSKGTGLDVSGWMWPIRPAQQAQVDKVKGLPTSLQARWLRLKRAVYLACADAATKSKVFG